MEPTDIAAEYVSKREFGEFRREIRGEFQHLLEKLDEVRKPADLKGIYQALLATVMIIITIGTLAMAPVWKSVGSLSESTIRQNERNIELAEWKGMIGERLDTTTRIAASLEEKRTDVSDTIDDNIRDRVLFNGFSRDDARRVETELQRLQDRINEIDRDGTAAFQTDN